MIVRRNSITVTPSWLNPVVRSFTMPIAGRDRVVIACPTEAECHRLGSVLETTDGAAKPLAHLDLTVGGVRAGFRLVEAGVVVLSAHELFHRTAQPATRVPVRRYESRAIDSFLDLAEGDLVVHVFHEQKLSLRLLAVRVPEEVAQQRRQRVRQEARKRGRPVSQRKLDLCEWNVLVTNAPEALLGRWEAAPLRRLRWQIELVFKVFKSEGQVGQARSQAPCRVLCELYAKLLGLVVQHWLTLVGTGPPLRRSLAKAARVVALNVGVLLAAWRGRLPLGLAVTIAAEGIDAGCRLEQRRRYPSTAQLLADLTLPFPFRPRYVRRCGRKPRTTLQKVA